MRLLTKNFICFSLVALLSCGLALTASAADKAKKKKGDPTASFFNLPKTITLSAEQEAQVAALKKEYSERITAAVKARAEILTADQKKAQADAQKDAKAAGKTGKEAREAVEAALNLTEEQKPKVAEADKKLMALRKEVTEKLHALLTDEQRSQVKTPKKKKAA